MYCSTINIVFVNTELKPYIYPITQPKPMQTLADPECYHEFCRLLMRLKSNYQLVELMKLDSYTRFLEVVAKFTLSSLQVCCY